MNLLIHCLRHVAIAASLIWLSPDLFAETNDASAEETAWFAGEWEVTPAPVKGYQDIVAESQGIVRIEHLGGSRLARHSPERNGRPAASVEFTVKKLGANFPWWADSGGSVLAKKISGDVFDLATVGPMGKAYGNRAWRHTRVKPQELTATLAPLQSGLVQILVNHVKPERRAYASWRILAPGNTTLAVSQDAGLPLEYLFLFDRLEAGVSYDLADYLRRGLGANAAERKMNQWREMLVKAQTVFSGAPL